jgi:hypothetical protein
MLLTRDRVYERLTPYVYVSISVLARVACAKNDDQVVADECGVAPQLTYACGKLVVN